MKICVIVDAYRFSKSYVTLLAQQNVRAIHVRSTIMPIPAFEDSTTFEPEDYLACFDYDGDLPTLVSNLKLFNPVAVIAGTEPAVLLADELAVALDCPANLPELSLARRDKYQMIAALKSAGIRHAESIETSSLTVAKEWVHAEVGFPVVVKPLRSAATDGVHICLNEAEFEEKFSSLLFDLNCMGQTNHQVLVQEYLIGTEYMINSVSCNGAHCFTDIWRCHKRERPGYGKIYDYEELLPSEGDVQEELKDYLTQVLTALGINVGAAHAEVMLTKMGPILIEVGARVGGNVNVFCHDQCLPTNQLELTLDAYIEPVNFFCKATHPYQLKTNMRTVLLVAEVSGYVESLPIIDVIKSCETVAWYHLHVSVGDYVDATFDLFSSPGKVILMHDNPEKIREDYERISRAMKQGIVLRKSVSREAV